MSRENYRCMKIRMFLWKISHPIVQFDSNTLVDVTHAFEELDEIFQIKNSPTQIRPAIQHLITHPTRNVKEP